MEKLSESSAYVGSTIKSWVSPLKQDKEVIYQLTLVTGDKRGAGTDANVYLTIRDSEGNVSRKIEPNNPFKNDHERGTVTKFEFGPKEGVKPPFEAIEIWRDNHGGISFLPSMNNILFGGATKDSADWFLDRIDITVMTDQNVDNITLYPFPVHRWISHTLRYNINLYDCHLPQHDLNRKQFRLEELQAKQKTYVFAEKVKGGPIRVKDVPSDENFSENFFWTFAAKKAALLASSKLIEWSTQELKSFDGFSELYQLGLKRLKTDEVWKEDWWFGLQRIQGVDPTIIQLCKEVPENLKLPEFISDLMEGKTISEALQKNRLFVCNLSILDGLECKAGREVASPIVLFYLNDCSDLLPIVIQLRQKADQDNPVYTPRDEENTWLLAKMFYNNAEAQQHQSVTHLGLTHLLMESFCVATHRCLSISHPLYRLMAPHFLYLIAINNRADEKLINPGGWIDNTMTQGVNGLFQLVARGFSKWNFRDTDPSFQIKKRGLLDARVLPYYPYRDDAVSLYRIIKNYVRKVVSHYYDSPTTVQNDWELKRFWEELTSPPPSGLGLKGIPGNKSSDDGGFASPEDIVDTVTGIISTCSLGHIATNAQQYDQYGFVPNYPSLLNEGPPRKKISYSEEDLIALLPSKESTLETMVITSLLSNPITNRLGDFEVQYLFSPKDVAAADSFRDELKELSEEIGRRNETRRWPYTDLDPATVPNSISI